MIDLGKYTADVLLAYGVSIALLAGLILASWGASRRMKTKLDKLERNQNG